MNSSNKIWNSSPNQPIVRGKHQSMNIVGMKFASYESCGSPEHVGTGHVRYIPHNSSSFTPELRIKLKFLSSLPSLLVVMANLPFSDRSAEVTLPLCSLEGKKIILDQEDYPSYWTNLTVLISLALENVGRDQRVTQPSAPPTSITCLPRPRQVTPSLPVTQLRTSSTNFPKNYKCLAYLVL